MKFCTKSSPFFSGFENDREIDEAEEKEASKETKQVNVLNSQERGR